MHVVEGIPSGKELPRYPAFLASRESFDNFWSELGKVQSQSDRWLSAELRRELCFCIDYLVTLHKLTEQVNDIGLPRLGVVIRNDIIGISSRIEDAAHDFINNDVIKLNFKTDRRWHKFKPEQTEKMFSDTILMKRQPELQDIVDGKIT